MNFLPMKETALIEVVPEATTSDSGIIISTKKSHKSTTGRILAVNSDNKKIAVNDLVIFSKFGVKEVFMDDKKYFSVKIPDILGVLKY